MLPFTLAKLSVTRLQGRDGVILQLCRVPLAL